MIASTSGYLMRMESTTSNRCLASMASTWAADSIPLKVPNVLINRCDLPRYNSLTLIMLEVNNFRVHLAFWLYSQLFYHIGPDKQENLGYSVFNYRCLVINKPFLWINKHIWTLNWDLLLNKCRECRSTVWCTYLRYVASNVVLLYCWASFMELTSSDISLLSTWCAISTCTNQYLTDIT